MFWHVLGLGVCTVYICNVLCSELSDGTAETFDGSSGYIRISDTQMLLTLADVADSGLYVCNATNDIGYDIGSAYLSVLGKNTRD